MSTEKRNPKDGPELSEAEAERLIHEALRWSGRFLPRTIEEVEAAEAELNGGRVQLPPSLRDPLAILDRERARRATVKVPTPADPEAESHMACAARNGSEIPPDVLAKMDEDEAHAESEQEPDDGKG